MVGYHYAQTEYLIFRGNVQHAAVAFGEGAYALHSEAVIVLVALCRSGQAVGRERQFARKIVVRAYHDNIVLFPL